MSKNCIALDLGSSAVKVMQIKKGRTGFQLLNFGIEPVPPDTIVDGAILNHSGVVEAVRRALPLTLRASCLTQALAGWIMLTRHGTESRIRIGVASPGQQGFKAHAWLESGGRVILGDVADVDAPGGLESFHVIWTLPPEDGAGV